METVKIMDLWIIYAILFLPVGFLLCFILAFLGMHIKKLNNDKCPTALKASFMNTNENASWDLE